MWPAETFLSSTVNVLTMYCIVRHYCLFYVIRAKNFNSLQSYVTAIWVKTQKQQKWFWGNIIACWIPDFIFIFHEGRVIVNFVPKFVAIATGVVKGYI